MADEIPSQFVKQQDQSETTSHRIEASRIKTSESHANGSRNVLLVATLINPPVSGELLTEMKVALKEFECNREGVEDSARSFKRFTQELSLMKTLSHPNITKLVGFVEDTQKGKAWIILPLEANGNVREFLQSGEWEIPERISLVQDTLNGLEYLHSRQPPICHGNLKSLNIVVNSSYHAVITDFGSARIGRRTDAAQEADRSGSRQPVDDIAEGLASLQLELDPSTLELKLTGPRFCFSWAAPEVLSDEMRELPSDVWAMGWICWEIITSKFLIEEFDSKAADNIQRSIRETLRPIQNETQKSNFLRLCSLMSNCWISDLTERIDSTTIRREAGLMESVTPSTQASQGPKIRSAELLLELGATHDLQNDTAAAESHYRSAFDIAVRTMNDVAKASALVCLGQVHRTQSRYQEAEAAFSEALQIYSQRDSSLEVANALVGLGQVYKTQSRNREAEKVIAEAYEIHSRIGNELGAANALVGLGQIYRAQSRYQEAKMAFTKAHETYSGIENDLGMANALVGLAQIHSAQSGIREAETAFTIAKDIYSRIGNDLGAANSWIGLGEIYDASSRYHEAERAFIKAHEIHSRIGNDLGAANASTGLGEIYSTQSKYSEAERAFKEAYEIQSRIGNNLGEANALAGLGELYSAQLKHREAENAFKKAQNIHSHVGNDVGLADALEGLGQIDFAQEKLNDAAVAFKEAIEIHTRIGNDLGLANALNGLGQVEFVQSRQREAEEAFKKAREIHSRIGNNFGEADALTGLGGIYTAQSKYRKAEEAFMEAFELHSRIGNELGAANALTWLGESYTAESRYSEAERAFKEAYEIHSRIGNDLGAANALTGLGESYTAESKTSEAERAFKDVHKIHSRIGNHLGAANALACLGEIYSVRSDYREAEKAFNEAHDIHSRIGNGHGVANALMGLGETYKGQSNYSDAEGVLTEAREIYSSIGGELGAANALVALGQIYGAQSRYDEAEKALKEALEIYSRIGNDARKTDALICLREIDDARPRCPPDPKERAFDEGPEIHFLVEDHLDAAKKTQELQQFDLFQEFSSLQSASTPGTKYIVDLIQALGTTIPTAIRNKHQLYRILIKSKDLCDYLNRMGDVGGESRGGLEVLEQFWEIMDGLERTLLELSEIVSGETVPFGMSSLATWNSSCVRLARIHRDLTASPFNVCGVTNPTHAKSDRYFDDCSWSSLLLHEGIEAPVQDMYIGEEGIPIEAQSVIDILRYLVNEMRLNGKFDEGFRALLIEIIAETAKVAMEGPKKASLDFWNAAASALEVVDTETPLNQDMVELLCNSWGSFVDRQTQPPSKPSSSMPASFQDQEPISLPEELTRLDHESTPATDPLISLLQTLGKAAPRAIRNKHKIYAIIIRGRDICNHILSIGLGPKFKGLEALDEYYNLIDALEGVLLDLARHLPAEQGSFGPEMCASWSESRLAFCQLFDKLHKSPFSLDLSSSEQDPSINAAFDDCYWLSLLLREGIEKELDRQYLDTASSPSAALVKQGLQYLENEIKCGHHDDTTRELVVDIVTRFYETLSASASKREGNTASRIGTAKHTRTHTSKKLSLMALSNAFSVLNFESRLQSQQVQKFAIKCSETPIYPSEKPSEGVIRSWQRPGLHRRRGCLIVRTGRIRKNLIIQEDPCQS